MENTRSDMSLVIAMSLLINRSGLLIGTVHALISLFLLLVMGLLIFQRTKLPRRQYFCCSVYFSWAINWLVILTVTSGGFSGRRLP